MLLFLALGVHIPWFLRKVVVVVYLESRVWLCNSRPLRPWDSPGKNTGVGCHFLLQGIFQTQGSNLRLLCRRWVLYHWATWEALVQTEAIQPCWKQNYSVMNERRTPQNDYWMVKHISHNNLASIILNFSFSPFSAVLKLTKPPPSPRPLGCYGSHLRWAKALSLLTPVL